MPGYAGYEVSDYGNVRSVERTVWIEPGVRAGYFTTRRSVLLKQSMRDRYLTVSLGRGAKNAVVHHLVLEAFVGPRPDGLVACHRDDDPQNNRLDNLRWDTACGNARDMVRNGNHKNSRKTQCPKGHPYDDENTALDGRGRRYCRTCNKVSCRAFYLARKAS